MAYKDKEKQAAAARRHYEKNKEKMKARAVAKNKAQSEVLTEYVHKVKDAPCTDCGVKYPPHVMDFDHISDKTANVSVMIRSAYSLQRLQEEIDKCELVCSNCHRQRTWNRRSINSKVECIPV